MNIGLGRLVARWFAAAVPALALAGCVGGELAPPRTFSRPEVVVHDPTRVPLAATSLGKMRDAVAARYRPGPDRRFLLAIAEVSLVLAPSEQPGQVTARFDGGRWHVASAGEEVGTLAEVPTYREAVALLARWTRRELDRNPIIFQGIGPDTVQLARQITMFRSREVAQALRSIDEKWQRGERSAGLLLCGARGLVYLAAQSLDRAEMADRLGARSLATLLIARAVAGQGLAREEVLLAQSLGYGADAADLAAALAPGDPVRLIVEGTLDTARTVPGEADPLTTYLYSAQFAAQWDRAGWREWLRTSSFPGGADLATLKPAVEPGRFDTKRDVPSLIQLTALAQAWEITGTDRIRAWAHRCIVEARLAHLGGTRRLSGRPANCAWPYRGILQPYSLALLLAATVVARRPEDARQGEWFAAFERTVARLGDRLTGPFLDPLVYGDYLRGHAYSALDVRSRFLLNSLASRPRALELAGGLSVVPRSPTVKIGRVIRELASMDGRQESAARLVAEMDSLSPPGTLVEMLEAAGEVFRRDTLMLLGVSRLVSRSDTRPRNMSRLADVAYSYLFDLFLSERFNRQHAGQAGAGAPFAAAWHAALVGDVPALWRLTEDRQRLPVRLRALDLLGRSGQASDASLDSAYHRLIADHPAAWDAREAYVKWLRPRPARRSRAIAVVETWLAEPGSAPGALDRTFARSALARLYGEEGRLDDAWRIIQPDTRSYQFGSLQRRAQILQQLGRNDEADSLASRAVRRYPALPAARAVLAEIRWRRGDMTGATSALQDPQLPRLTGNAWRKYIGPAFLRAFTPAPDADLVTLSRRLSTSGIGRDELMELAAAAADSGRNDIAFTVLSTTLEGSDARVRVALAYTYLHAWRGPEVATAWARPKLSPQEAVRTSWIFYRHRVFDGLWDLTDGDYPNDDTRRYFWLLRAAAAIQDPHLSQHRRLALQRHFARAEVEPYHTLGRFLLGLEDETLLFVLADSPHRRCEVAYFLGVKARSQGRLREASEWFRVAIETNQTQDGEYQLAWDELARWFDPKHPPTAASGLAPGS